MSKIVCISDIHNRYNGLVVPDGDILIIAGDWSHAGKEDECITFNDWLKDLPHKHKLYIPGNHEVEFSKRVFFRDLLSEIENINQRTVTIDGLKIYGNSYTLPGQYTGAYGMTEKEQTWMYTDAPQDVDILVTHGAPYGILDKSVYGKHNGSKALLAYVEKVKPKLHIFGHIHEAYGTDIYSKCKTIFVNASVVNEKYKLTNKPIVIPMDND